jgi:hypothetical protein
MGYDLSDAWEDVKKGASNASNEVNHAVSDVNNNVNHLGSDANNNANSAVDYVRNNPLQSYATYVTGGIAAIPTMLNQSAPNQPTLERPQGNTSATDATSAQAAAADAENQARRGRASTILGAHRTLNSSNLSRSTLLGS